METNNKIKCCWITLNRACNLRCGFCYAQRTGYSITDNVPLVKAKNIVDFCLEIGVKQINLMGGEPTLYKDLFSLINYANDKGIKTALVTNGIALNNKEFVQQLKESGLSYIGLSLKGYNEDNFKEVTGTNGYKKVLSAISNISDAGIKFSVSMVLEKGNIPYICRAVNDAKQRGVTRFSFSFAYDFDINSNLNHLDLENNPFILMEEFKKIYNDLDKATRSNFSLELSFPLCVWDKALIEEMIKKHQITSGCQLLSRSGVIFDTNLNFIPCNSMYEYPIGKFGVDFTDGNTFYTFFNSEKIKNIYDKLCSPPSVKCIDCSDYSKCGGGCVGQWLHYSLEDLYSLKDKLYSS